MDIFRLTLSIQPSLHHPHAARSLLAVMARESGAPDSLRATTLPPETRQMWSLPGTNFPTRQKVLPAMRDDAS